MDSAATDFIILFITILLSIFFSGSETALFSLKKSDLHRYALSDNKKEKLISGLMKKPENLLITILSGNLLVNIVLTAVSTNLALGIWKEYGHLLTIAVATPLIIIFCEISPKAISVSNYENYSKRIITPLSIFHFLYTPFRVVLLAITNFIIRIFALRLNDEKPITEQELSMALRLGHAEGVINKDEEIFLKNVLRFSKKEAQNVMIPRNKAIFISCNSTIDEALKIFMETGTVRAPVYKNNPDNIIGMLDSRELLPYALGFKKAKKVNKFIHNTYHYPASKELGELLNDFLDRKIQIAIVVDEFGGTAGVVTLTSILSELMGRNFVQWEDKQKTEKEIRKVNDNTTVISGEMQIHDFNFHFDGSLESEDAETIGGFIIEALGHFPRRLESVKTEKYIFKVRNIRKNRVESVELIENNDIKTGK